MPARVATFGRKLQRQCVITSLQPAQRSFTEPPRAKKGFVLRAKRAARKRETACGVVNCWLLAFKPSAADAARKACCHLDRAGRLNTFGPLALRESPADFHSSRRRGPSPPHAMRRLGLQIAP
jgi:hypothetical protein